MKLNAQKPRNFINPLLSRKAVDTEKFNVFKLALEHYKKSLADQLSTKQTEPNIVTNTLKPFLDSFGFLSEANSQKGQISIDLAVMQHSKPSVIIEAKMPNSADMILAHDLHKKAFCQAIMYFMNERAKNNTSLYHIIITDFNNWFVFDAKDFDRHFWRNANIKKLYDAYTSKSLLGDTTAEFYQALERELPNLKKDLLDPEEIDCAHFNIQLPASDKELTAIYKLLSADCLLKAFNPNDANSLNREFYTELLYILGLEESKDGGKKIIGKAKNPQHGTLYENISNKLAQYNKPNDFEAVIKLIIIWVNRILFLKLLESQIVKWTGKQDQKFLNPNTLDQYDALETLFFEVLAKPIDKRNVRDFDHIPYLNSALFEIHADENNGIKVSNLVDGIEIDYYAKTVVKDENKQRKTGKASTLPYLLAFLDAFDFSNDSDEELVKESKSLISASVLGLIFEKINGYKDGSFYTPSFITMYMARETISKTVIDKFNSAKGWQCKTLTDLHNKDLDITEANALINSIKICDPAVGSGHFLVSALNEMLRIKSELGVLVSEDGKRIKDYSLSIENDDLIIKSAEGELFEYKKGNSEKTRIQKTLFKEKQLLIENCLFGVDINPNSVNICRLRLWIELLKNAYYKEDGQLDTLPNIDINIKCGNSLISRFGLSDDLDSKTIKAEIQDYKQKVTQYKENIGSKRDVVQAIDAMKAKFQQTLKSGHAATQTFNQELSEYVREYDYESLSKDLAFVAFNLKLPRATHDMFGKTMDEKAKTKKREKVEDALTKAKEIESGKIYQNAFEWRFEFPEVLNEAGEFVGFDVVIGNPPYIGIEDIAWDNRRFYEAIYKSAVGRFDLYSLFIEKGMQIKQVTGSVSYIVPGKFLNNKQFVIARKIVCENHGVSIVKIDDKVFEGAQVDSVIVNSHSAVNPKYEALKISSQELQFLSETDMSCILKDKEAIFRLEIDAKFDSLISKIEINTYKVKEIADVRDGIVAGSIKDLLFIDDLQDQDSHKLYFGKHLSKYRLSDTNIWVNYKPDEMMKEEVKRKEGKRTGLWMRDEKIFKREKILSRFVAKEVIAAYDNESRYYEHTLHSTHITDKRFKTKFILGLFNSNLFKFYYRKVNSQGGDIFPQVRISSVENLPIKLADSKMQESLELLVDNVILAKQNGTDTSQLEAEVDAMVYGLYGLSDDEIKLVEGVA